MNAHTEGHVVVHATVVLLFIVASGSAHADCEWSDRIDMDDAECLTGEWTNRTWPAKDTAEVKNECSEYGTVVAKVDREGAADWTKWLENKEIHSMSGAYGNIRGIHCCSDLSDLCNKKDMINPANCVAEFRKSPAYEEPTTPILFDRRSCGAPQATADADAETCSIQAECGSYQPQGDGTSRYIVRTRQITVPYLEVSTVILKADGHLSRE